MLPQFFQSCFSDFYRGCYYFILLIATAIGVAYYKRSNKVFRCLCILIIVTFISEFTAKYLGVKYGSNAIVYNIFTPIEYFIYANIYSLFLAGKKWKKILALTVAFLIVFDIINMIYFQSIDEVPTNTINIEMVLLVFLSLVLFIKIREEPVYENIITEGVFWFNTVVLFYYAFNILIWGFYGVMYGVPDPPKINGKMLLLSSSLLYTLYIFSILLSYYSPNKSSLKNA